MANSPHSEPTFVPGPILLLGAPGVGKGTQAQVLMERWGIPQVSTGDIIRENIHFKTEVGLRFQELVRAGTFVPDDVVNRMVAERISKADCERGFILDGFPRTVGQAIWLDSDLQVDRMIGPEFFGERSPPLIAVSIEVRYDELLRRITGRRTGPVSKRIYNVYTNPPVNPGVCDVDGEPLVQRPDDTEEVFAERMKAFTELTAPVIEHYRGLGRFEVVDGEQTVETVTGSIVAALKRLRLEDM